MESAPKEVVLKLDLDTIKDILNAVAHQYNYVTAQPIIDNIKTQLIDKIEEE